MSADKISQLCINLIPGKYLRILHLRNLRENPPASVKISRKTFHVNNLILS